MALFEAYSVHSNAISVDDDTLDGGRFLINTTSSPGAACSPPLNVVMNWSAELKK